MDKRSLENRLFLFAASRNQDEETCRIVSGKRTNTLFLQVLSNCVSSEFISDVAQNVCSEFSLFSETFESNTMDFLFLYD